MKLTDFKVCAGYPIFIFYFFIKSTYMKIIASVTTQKIVPYSGS